MKNIQKPMKTMVSLAVIALLTHQESYAGAFSLYTESSAAAIGNYAAGIAAEGADASIGWYNPAGLVLIKEQQVLLGGVGVFPVANLAGTSTYTTALFPPPNPPFQYVQSFSGLEGAKNAGVPSVHYALPLGERAVFGLSIVSPFGLSTKYSLTSPVRYAATWSDFETVNVAPELGGELTNNFSIGAGLDLQYALVKFNRMIGSPALMQGVGLPPTLLDSESYNSGHSFAIGFHVGGLFRTDDNHSRIGLNYQSQMRHEFTGYSLLTGPLADTTFVIFEDPLAGNPNSAYRTGNLRSNDIVLPDIITLSGYRDLNEKWALLGSVVYTGWSSFKTIELDNVAAAATLPPDGQVVQLPVSSTTPEHYRDAWRFAIGANYHVNEVWMLRGGVGYDQTPTVNAYRDVRLPDVDRWALAIGAHYQMRPNLGFDAGYSYLFASHNTPINNTIGIGSTSSYNVEATSKPYVNLVGLQVVWKIDYQEKAGMKA